jgi:hypothetical protein
MYLPKNVKSPNNIIKWQMGFNLAFKGLRKYKNNSIAHCTHLAGRANVKV